MSKLSRCIAPLLLAAALLPGVVEAEWRYDKGMIWDSEEFRLRVDNRAQVRFGYRDPDLGDRSASFDLARYKLRLNGTFHDDWQFSVQTNFTDTDNSARALEDAWFMFSRRSLAQLWVGQGKVFFGRQQLASTGKLQFLEASLAAQEFLHGDAGTDNRDVGIALFGENRARTYHYAVGLYNGNGINKDEDDNTDYMVTGRLVVTPFGDYAVEDSFGVRELAETDVHRLDADDPDARKSRLAVGISARTIAQGTEAINEERRDNTAVLEVAYKIYGLNLAAEFFTRSADLPLGVPGNEEDTDGLYVQAGWLFRNGVEVAGRYSEVIRDVPDDDETEWGVALNYYLDGHDYKLQTDYRVLDYEGIPATPQIDNWEMRVQFQAVF